MSDKNFVAQRQKSPHIRSVREVCLLTFYHLNKKQHTTFLHSADEKLICCICECVLNTLKNNISLERYEKNRLTKYKALRRGKTRKLDG